MTDLERLRGKEGKEDRVGRQSGGEDSRRSVLSLASRTRRVLTHQGSLSWPRAGPEDGGADGHCVAARVSAVSGKNRWINRKQRVCECESVSTWIKFCLS